MRACLSGDYGSLAVANHKQELPVFDGVHARRVWRWYLLPIQVAVLLLWLRNRQRSVVRKELKKVGVNGVAS